MRSHVPYNNICVSRGSPFPRKLQYTEAIIRNPKTRDQLNHTKICKNCLWRDVSVCVLRYYGRISVNSSYIGLKMVFIPGSQHQARASYKLIINLITKPLYIVAFWPQRVSPQVLALAIVSMTTTNTRLIHALQMSYYNTNHFFECMHDFSYLHSYALLDNFMNIMLQQCYLYLLFHIYCTNEMN